MISYSPKEIARYARYASNALFPYPTRDKIVCSKYNNNTTNFIYTTRAPLEKEVISLKRGSSVIDLTKYINQ